MVKRFRKESFIIWETQIWFVTNNFMERFYKILAQSKINIIPLSSSYGFASEAYFQKNLNEILNQTNIQGRLKVIIQFQVGAYIIYCSHYFLNKVKCKKYV